MAGINNRKKLLPLKIRLSLFVYIKTFAVLTDVKRKANNELRRYPHPLQNLPTAVIPQSGLRLLSPKYFRCPEFKTVLQNYYWQVTFSKKPGTYPWVTGPPGGFSAWGPLEACMRCTCGEHGPLGQQWRHGLCLHSVHPLTGQGAKEAQ